MNVQNRKNLFNKLATLLGVAGASALLSLPVLAQPNTNSNIIAQSSGSSGGAGSDSSGGKQTKPSGAPASRGGQRAKAPVGGGPPVRRSSGS